MRRRIQPSTIAKEGPQSERFYEPRGGEAVLGQWYWVHPVGWPKEADSAELALPGAAEASGEEGELEEDKQPWLGCVTYIGSNYAELTNVREGSTRIHLDAFDTYCRHEPNAEAFINTKVQGLQREVGALMKQVNAVTQQLAVTPSTQLQDGSQHALVLHDKGEAIGNYKTALIRAKEETLPELFKRIESTNRQMGMWMQASLIPLKAQADGLKEVLEHIGARIFNVELYAGLVEEVELVKDGKAADMATPIHLFQRRHYMDEECLVQYEAGGMEFRDIGAFDRWLSKPENFQRLLPHARSIVAFRVRRHEKERHAASFAQFIRFLFEGDADKLTFLYIRNGERLYRLSTGIDFGATLFPDFDNSQLTGKLYGRSFAGNVDGLITEGAWLEMRAREEAEQARRDAAYEKEMAEWPVKMAEYREQLKAIARARRKMKKQGENSLTDEEAELLRSFSKPRKPSRPWQGYVHHESEQYEPFEPSNLHYDDMRKYLQKQMDEHNRLVLVLQGLLDRSPVLHPHPPWKLFEPSGFKAALVLVYDDTRALVPGEAPDFEAYRLQLNSTLKPGCVTVGQQFAWLRKEAEKENERRDRDWRRMNDWELHTYQPYGNPGPGTLARVEKVSRTGVCHYSWWKDRLRRPTWKQALRGHVGDVRAHFQCHTSVVLNVDTYKRGDFRKFYEDPRTRENYLKWAPLLLVAEEYHAGKRQIDNEEQEET